MSEVTMNRIFVKLLLNRFLKHPVKTREIKTAKSIDQMGRILICLYFAADRLKYSDNKITVPWMNAYK